MAADQGREPIAGRDGTASDLTVAWRAYRARWRFFSATVLVLFGSWVALEVAVIATNRLGFMVWAVLHLAFFFVFAGLMAGFHRACVAAIEQRPFEFSALFGAFDRAPAVLAAFALCLLAAPTVYLAIRLVVAGQVASIEPGRGVGRTLALTRGHVGGAMRVLLTLIIFNAAGAAILGAGLLISLPLSTLAATRFYLRVKTPALLLPSAESRR